MANEITNVSIDKRSVKELVKELAKSINSKSRTSGVDNQSDVIGKTSKSLSKGLSSALEDLKDDYRKFKKEVGTQKDLHVARKSMTNVAKSSSKKLEPMKYSDMNIMKLAHGIVKNMDGDRFSNLSRVLTSLHETGRKAQQKANTELNRNIVKNRKAEDKASRKAQKANNNQQPSELTNKKPAMSFGSLIKTSNKLLKSISESNVNILNKKVDMSPSSLGMGVLGAAAFGLLNYIGADIGGQFGGSVRAIGKIGYKIATRVPQELLDMTLKTVKTIGTKISKEIIPLLGKVAVKAGIKLDGKLITKILPKFKFLGKTLFKTLGKAIPVVGSLFDLYSAFQRVQRGDYVGALIDIAAGAADFIPMAGPAISIGLTLLNAGRDFKKSDADIARENANKENFSLKRIFTSLSDAVSDAVKKYIEYVPIYHVLTKYGEAYANIKKGNISKALLNMASATVGIIPGAGKAFDAGMSILGEKIVKHTPPTFKHKDEISLSKITGSIHDKIKEKIQNFITNSKVGQSLTSMSNLYDAAVSGDLEGSIHHLNELTGGVIPFINDDDIIEKSLESAINKKKKKVFSYVKKNEKNGSFNINVDDNNKEKMKLEKEKLKIYERQLSAGEKTNKLLEKLNTNSMSSSATPRMAFLN